MIRLSIWRLEFSAIVNNPLQMPKSKLRKEKAESTEKQEEHSEEASQEQNPEQNPEGEILRE